MFWELLEGNTVETLGTLKSLSAWSPLKKYSLISASFESYLRETLRKSWAL